MVNVNQVNGISVTPTIQESGGANLLVGAVADGEYLKRSGTGITSGVPAGSLDIHGLTAADPAVADEVPEYNAAAGANRKVTVEKLGGFLCSVSELRLTLASGTPVTSTDQVAKGTLYLTPYNGNRIILYDGTRWLVVRTAEVSLSLTVTSGKNYDVFAYYNAGAVALELSAAWTNDTTQADAIAQQDGVDVKSSDHSRLWVGTIRASATNQTTDSGYEVASAVSPKRFVWNRYNRVMRELCKKGVTAHNYGTQAYRAFNNDATNIVEWVTGRAEDGIGLRFGGNITYGTTGPGYLDLGLDSTTSAAGIAYQYLESNANTAGRITSGRSGSIQPQMGYHYVSLMEYGDGSAGGCAYSQYQLEAYLPM